MGTDLTLATTLIGSLGVVVVGVAWVVRKLMQLGEYVSENGPNRFRRLEERIQRNEDRINALERTLPRMRMN